MNASAQTMMRDYAAFKWPSLNHKGRMARLATKLGFGQRRTRALYHNELGTAVRADELAAIAALQKEEADAVRASQENYRALEARIAQLEALFAAGDEEFGREQVAAYRAALGGQGGGIGRGGEGNGPAGRDALPPGSQTHEI